MKCSSCGYEHGWAPEKLDIVEGEHGEFYQLPIEMKRNVLYGTQTAEVYACPVCGNMQIDIQEETCPSSKNFVKLAIAYSETSRT